jgi:hypothetical protein
VADSESEEIKMKTKTTRFTVSLCLLALLVGSHGNSWASNTNSNLSFSIDPLHVGSWTMAILTGAGPQETVACVYSRNGTGSFDAGSGLILDLAPPILKAAYAQTNYAGTAMSIIPIGPNIDEIGQQLWGQAVVKDAHGDYWTSAVITETIQP